MEPDPATDRPLTGLIVGRFMPPHEGHSFLITWAARHCERLVVYVNTRASEPIPGALRQSWLADLHPEVTVVEVAHDLDTNWDDEDLWQRWIDLFRARWPHASGPDVVFSSEEYGGEIARRLGAEHVIVDLRREAVPISATMIREDPHTHLEFLAPPVRAWVEAWARRA